MRTRAERRHNDWTKARRKRRITKQVYWSFHDDGWEYYDNLHQYSKNKIHCSCPLCTSKMRNRKRYGKVYSPSIGDLKKLEKIKYELDEEE